MAILFSLLRSGRRSAFMCILLLVLCGSAAAQIEVGPVDSVPVTPEGIRKVIAERVEMLLKAQHADGSWEIHQKILRDFKGGTTAFCLLALQHCHPHLEGDLAMRTRQAIDKGIACVVDSPYECTTYSAALAIATLHLQDPERYRNKITVYTNMLCSSQAPGGRFDGMWAYILTPPNNLPTRSPFSGKVTEWGDNSNTQMAILGLYHAYRAGIPVPPAVLRNTRTHYQKTQQEDGGWGYKDDFRPLPYGSMTVAGIITLNLTNELLFASTSKPCEPMPKDEALEKGFQWLDGNLNYKFLDLYGLYTVERLGILMGQRELHGKDWFNIGAGILLAKKEWNVELVDDKNSVAGTAFGLLFLSRGLEPIIIHKLKWKGNDWDNSHYAVKHLTEYISDRYQKPRQWRVVDLDAPQNVLNSVPILMINGRQALRFSKEDQEKLLNYVNAGGTIIGVPCIGGKAFDESFRELMKTLFPESALAELPADHQIFSAPRAVTRKVVVEALSVGKGDQERCAVFYLPQGTCSQWHRWAKTDQWTFDLGANLFFYIDRVWRVRIAAQEAEKKQ